MVFLIKTMKTEFKVIDSNGFIFQDTEIQLPDNNCKERIVMITQDNILKIMLKFKLEDGKIVNPDLMKIICDGSGVTIDDEFIGNVKPQEHVDLEAYKQEILSDFAMWLDCDDWQSMLEAYNGSEEE